MRIPPPYEDRKLLKWKGFFLSEHTKQMSEVKKEKNFVVPAKELMTSDEIDRTLYEARLKDKSVAIQKEEMNEEGQYQRDIVGKVQGYDELGIYIDDQKIDYDEIRNVEFVSVAKWSALEE